MIQDFYPFSQLLASEMNHVCLVMGTMVLVTGMFLHEIIFTKKFLEIDFTEIRTYLFLFTVLQNAPKKVVKLLVLVPLDLEYVVFSRKIVGQ